MQIYSFPFSPIRNWLQRLILAVAILLFGCQVFATDAIATGIYDMPTVASGDRTWVIDQGDILSRSTETNLSKSLETLAEKTGYEVRFVTFRRLDYGETIDTFAQKLFDKWFPTSETSKNQTLLVLDKITNNSALVTGDGVKSLLTPDIAKSVNEESLQIPLRDGDKYNEAVVAVADRVATVLSGEPDPGPPQVTENVKVEGTFKKAEETKGGDATVAVIVLLLLATVIPMVTYYWYQGFSSN